MSKNTLRERIAIGCGMDENSDFVKHVEACVADLLRNKICSLTLSPTESVRVAGWHLLRELGLEQNVKDKEAPVT